MNNSRKVGFLVMMVAGNVFLAMGISIFKFSVMGNDPYSAMVMALADVTGVAYANLLVILNLALFVVEVIWGRKYIGAGTIVNALLLGYIVTFFYNIWIGAFGAQTNLPLRLVIMILGVLTVSLGVSLYQGADTGVAPYDALSLIMAERCPKIGYQWHRIATDSVCALVCFLAGGLLGLGTVACALCLGPVIHFYDRTVTARVKAIASGVSRKG